MKPLQILAAVALVVAFGANAQTGSTTGANPTARQPATAAAPQSDGEVRKIDKEQGKLTLRHGPLPHLDMPAMTMIFRAADPKLLEGLKEGDKVKFSAEKVNGAFTVTVIQVVR